MGKVCSAVSIYLTWVVVGVATWVVVGVAAQPARADRERIEWPNVRVTLNAKGKPLPLVLADLAAQSKLDLSAVQHLADRRVTLFVRNEPLESVTRQLSTLWSIRAYPAYWRPVKKRSSAFELWQDPRADAELQRVLAADRAKLAESLERLMQWAERADLPQGPTGDPITDRAVGTPNWKNGLRAQMQLLGTLPPETRGSVVNGNAFWAPVSKLPPATQDALGSTFGATQFRFVRGADGANRPETEDERRSRFSNSNLGLRLQLDLNPRRAWHMYLYTQDPGHSGLMMRGFPLAPLGISEAAGTESSDLDGEPVPPDLQHALRSVRGWKHLADFQEFLAAHLRRPVVSDFCHETPAPTPQALLECRTLREVLDRATQPINYRHWRLQSALLFRNAYWYLDDLNEVPATVELRLTAHRRKTGYLDLDHLAEAASLSETQLHRLESVLPGIEGMAPYRRVLAWYNALPESLRRKARTSSGLEVRESRRLATGALFPSGDPGPLFALFPQPLRTRMSLTQNEREDGTVTLIEITGEGGSRVRYHFLQPRTQASQTLNQ